MSIEVTVRPLKREDLEALIEIDARITGERRADYYREKVEAATRREAQINSSLVATVEGKVVGFLMGTLHFGEFGIPENSAIVDTLGVDPEYQDRGIGSALFTQYLANMRAALVHKVYTLVDWEEMGLLKFFANMGFEPGRKLSLECSLFKGGER